MWECGVTIIRVPERFLIILTHIHHSSEFVFFGSVMKVVVLGYLQWESLKSVQGRACECLLCWLTQKKKNARMRNCFSSQNVGGSSPNHKWSNDQITNERDSSNIWTMQKFTGWFCLLIATRCEHNHLAHKTHCKHPCDIGDCCFFGPMKTFIVSVDANCAQLICLRYYSV